MLCNQRRGTSLLRIMTTSQIWTGIILVSMVAFMTLRTVIRVRKHKRVLPSLQNISGGPFSSTRTGSEGIIVPVLNYRKNVESKSFMKKPRQRMMKDQSESKNDDTEILTAMKLIEENQLKFIDEDPGGDRSNNEPKYIDHNHALPITENEGFGSSLGLPLEAAYHPTRLVSEVWQSRETGVTHLYRYSNLDRLVYPPGMRFRHSTV